MNISIDIPDKQVDTVVRSFLAGDVPHAFALLGGEEFRSLIGQADDMDAAVDLTAITKDQGIALVDACVRAYIRAMVGQFLRTNAEAEIHAAAEAQVADLKI